MFLVIKTQPFNSLDGYTTNDAYDLVVGSVSSDAYFLEYAAGSTEVTVIQRKHLNGTQVWIKAYQYKLSVSGASLNQLETDIYYSVYSTTFYQIGKYICIFSVQICVI